MPQDAVEFTTMRCPTDVNQKVKVIAELDGISVQEWSNTEFRAFVDKIYAKRMVREARKTAELGDPVG